MSATTTRQRITLKSIGMIDGVGLQTGQHCHLKIGPPNDQKNSVTSGILFRRVDLPQKPTLTAALHCRDPKSFRTTNLICKKAQVGTVEHLMAALTIAGIDDALIDLQGPEIPILDGSAAPFLKLIENCGRKTSLGLQTIWSPSIPIAYQCGNTRLIAMPDAKPKVSCLINYPKSTPIGCQYYTSELSQAICSDQLAPSRTFCLLQEAEIMREKGLMLGGSLKNALIIDQKRVLNEEGLRFSDEMVRHKTLDLIGDLALLNFDLKAHIIAICPSHEANAAFARTIEHQFNSSQ